MQIEQIELPHDHNWWLRKQQPTCFGDNKHRPSLAPWEKRNLDKLAKEAKMKAQEEKNGGKN
jgi:hypothetical protein